MESTCSFLFLFCMQICFKCCIWMHFYFIAVVCNLVLCPSRKAKVIRKNCLFSPITLATFNQCPWMVWATSHSKLVHVGVVEVFGNLPLLCIGSKIDFLDELWGILCSTLLTNLCQAELNHLGRGGQNVFAFFRLSWFDSASILMWWKRRQ